MCNDARLGGVGSIRYAGAVPRTDISSTKMIYPKSGHIVCPKTGHTILKKVPQREKRGLTTRTREKPGHPGSTSGCWIARRVGPSGPKPGTQLGQAGQECSSRTGSCCQGQALRCAPGGCASLDSARTAAALLGRRLAGKAGFWEGEGQRRSGALPVVVADPLAARDDMYAQIACLQRPHCHDRLSARPRYTGTHQAGSWSLVALPVVVVLLPGPGHTKSPQVLHRTWGTGRAGRGGGLHLLELLDTDEVDVESVP
jgi:hypothetical protein